MKRLFRRMVLSLAALSPGVASLTVQELAVSAAITILGVTSLLSVAAAVLAVSPKIHETLAAYDPPNTEYPSLLTQAALASLRAQPLDPTLLRAEMTKVVAPTTGITGFLTRDDRVAMMLSQVMAQWQVTDVLRLTDDQARELWLVERLLRASPEEAGALSHNFTKPDALLAMRDRVAEAVPVSV